MEIRFRQHAEFHRTAVGMTVGSAALAVVLAPVTQLAPLIAGIFGLAVGASVGHGRWIWRLSAAAIATGALVGMPAQWQTLLVCALIAGVGLTIGVRGMRAIFSLVFGAAVVLLGMWTALRFSHAQRTLSWPGWASAMAAGSAMGIVGVLAMLPRHLGVVIDPIAGALRGLPTNLDPEVRALCRRSVAIWETTKARLDEHEAGRALVRDGVLKALEVATRSGELTATSSSDEELGRRMEDLDARIAAATDDEVRAQYQAARAALSDQRRYRDGIAQNRERLVARLHNHVAALEKFQLASGGLAAVRAASTTQAASDQLAALSVDVATSGEALAEVEMA